MSNPTSTSSSTAIENPSGTSSAFRAPRRKLIFGVVAIALLMGAIDQNIVATALSPIGHSLHSSVNWTAWTVTAYSFGVVLIVPIAGRIADQYGRRRIFLLSVIVFTGASLACGLATNIYELVCLRAIQALGGGAFLPPATGIIADNFGDDRDRAIAMFSSIFPLGAFIGPIVGGIIAQDWSWRGIFLINIPLGALLLVVGMKILPKSPPKPGITPDLRGTVYLALLLIPGMYGITSLGSGHESLLAPQFLVSECVALAAFVVLRRHLRAMEHPIIPLDLLRQRNFAVMNIISLLNGGVMLGFATLVPLYAERRYGLHIFQAGTVLTGRAIGSIFVASATTFLLRRIGYRIPMVAGFSVAALGLVMVALSPIGLSTYWWLGTGAMVMGIGGGMAAPAQNNAILFVAPDQASSIMGLRNMFRQVGGIVTISVITALAARSGNEGLALGHAFFYFAVAFIVVIIPLVLTVPTQRGKW